jgi:hypothetical protein
MAENKTTKDPLPETFDTSAVGGQPSAVILDRIEALEGYS